MNVLSLFDGISCGMVALKKLGIPIDHYYASEIDPLAIKVSASNFPEIIQIGDVNNINFKDYLTIDLLLGGSPCQDLSIIKSKERKGLKGNKSHLFWKYKEALDVIKPKYFLFENVASMNDEEKDVITHALGVKPICINANIFVPQNRERYYWTNILLNPMPKSTAGAFVQIMENDIKDKFYYDKPFDLFEDKTKNIIGEIHLNVYEMHRKVYNEQGTIACLTCVSGGYQEKKVYDSKVNKVRKLTPVEYERLQGLPDNYTSILSNTKRYTACGNGWCVPVIAYLLEGLVHSN